MLDWTERSKMLPIAATRNGLRGWLFGSRFVPVMAGGEGDDDPKGGDPPKGDDPPKGKDGKEFDADRAQRTIDQLREEIKGLKSTSKEAETLRAKLKEIEDAKLSDTEKLAAQAKEASEKLTAAEARVQDLAIRLAVERAARKLNFIDEDDAFRLIDRKAIEFDDDGEPKNVDDLLTALSKAKPHLVKPAEGDEKKDDPKAAKTPTPTPKPDSKKDLPSEQLEAARNQTAAFVAAAF